jgi:hypothetical protein
MFFVVAYLRPKTNSDKIRKKAIKIIFHPLGSLAGFPARFIVL